MEKEISFIELINHIFLRPGMYTPQGSFNEIHSLLTGYFIGNRDTPVSGKSSRIFDQYVCKKYGFPTKYDRGYVIQCCSRNDNEALELYKEVIFEFIELKDNMTDDEILEYANSDFIKEEGEPERLFRAFEKAILKGEECAIKPFIIEHENQSVLWKGAYPKDVTVLLDQLSDGQPIKAIYDQVDPNKVKLITENYPFPIEMKLIGGYWKIDASRLIEMRID